MTPDDGQDSHPDRRATRDVSGDAITLRQPEDDGDVFEVEMPIATTGEVRNEGDEPLTRDELSGMSRQIDERAVPVFLDHGGTDLGGRSRYSAVEKVGEWTGGTVQERDADDSDELVATARMMDPESLPNGVGPLREALGSIKEQVKRDFSLSASIGWRDDEDYPGGVDLMEASIVGIGADPRTTSDAAVALARAATVASEADDPDAVIDRFRDVTHDMTDDTDTSAENDADEHDDEPDESREAPEWAERMLELQAETNDTLQTVADAVRPNDDEDDEDEDDDEENEADEDDEEEDDDDEQSADEPDDEQALRDEVADLREELADIRDGGLDADDMDRPDPDGEQDAGADDESDEATDDDRHELSNKYGISP